MLSGGSWPGDGPDVLEIRALQAAGIEPEMLVAE